LEKEKRKFKAWYAEMRVQRREQEQKLRNCSTPLRESLDLCPVSTG
jgi:hypothetical protein